DVALAIMVADCPPVLLSDAGAGVVAAAHAGRVGLLDGVLERTVEAMSALGARAERLEVTVGPSICGSCYEVPAEVREPGGGPARRRRWHGPGCAVRPSTPIIRARSRTRTTSPIGAPPAPAASPA